MTNFTQLEVVVLTSAIGPEDADQTLLTHNTHV